MALTNTMTMASFALAVVFWCHAARIVLCCQRDSLISDNLVEVVAAVVYNHFGVFSVACHAVGLSSDDSKFYFHIGLLTSLVILKRIGLAPLLFA